jgi:hypothetical protein
MYQVLLRPAAYSGLPIDEKCIADVGSKIHEGAEAPTEKEN